MPSQRTSFERDNHTFMSDPDGRDMAAPAAFAAVEPALMRFIHRPRYLNLLQAAERCGYAGDDVVGMTREAFLEAVKAGHQIAHQDQGAVLRWSECVARNVLMDLSRKDRRRPAERSIGEPQEDNLPLTERIAGPLAVEQEATLNLVLRHVWQIAEQAFLEYAAPSAEEARLQQIALKLVLLDGQPLKLAVAFLQRKLPVNRRETPPAQLAAFLCSIPAARRLSVLETLQWQAPPEQQGQAVPQIVQASVALHGTQVISTIICSWPRCCSPLDLTNEALCTSLSLRYLALRLHLSGLDQKDVCAAVATIGQESGRRCSPAAVNNWLGYSHPTSAWVKLVGAMLEDSFEILLPQLVADLLRTEKQQLSGALSLPRDGVAVKDLPQLLVYYYRGRLPECPLLPVEGDEMARQTAQFALEKLAGEVHRELVKTITARLGDVLAKRSDAGSRRCKDDEQQSAT